MQIYTHTIAGALVGALITRHDPGLARYVGPIIGAAGGFFPDSMIGFQVLVDKLKKRKPFSNEPEGGLWFYLKEISHSPLWLLGLLGFMGDSYASRYLAIFCLGIGLHILMDMLTHCGKQFADTDQSLAFPFYEWGWCPKLGQVFGIWEYRYDYKAPGYNKNMFEPKPEEGIFCAILVLALICALL
jgi:hypothetical protein